MIAPEASAEFVASMERVLDVYKRPLDARRPVVCMDETPRQLIGQTREPIAAAPGQPEREDYEYRRLGTCNVFMACEPLAGTRMTQVTERRTKRDWALFVESIAAHYPEAERITLVMDNLNTHTPAPLYEAASSEDIGAYRSSEDCSGVLRSPTRSLSASTCWRATPKASCSSCALACHLAASSWC